MGVVWLTTRSFINVLPASGRARGAGSGWGAVGRSRSMFIRRPSFHRSQGLRGRSSASHRQKREHVPHRRQCAASHATAQSVGQRLSHSAHPSSSATQRRHHQPPGVLCPASVPSPAQPQFSHFASASTSSAMLSGSSPQCTHSPTSPPLHSEHVSHQAMFSRPPPGGPAVILPGAHAGAKVQWDSGPEATKHKGCARAVRSQSSGSSARPRGLDAGQ